MTTLFISDLHLEASQPEIGEQFLSFLSGEAREAEALYILGDLFEVWLGDDDPNPYYGQMKTALRELVDAGVPVSFMHGNRDFTIGETFASETGVSILADPVVALPASACHDTQPGVASDDVREVDRGTYRVRDPGPAGKH